MSPPRLLIAVLLTVPATEGAGVDPGPAAAGRGRPPALPSARALVERCIEATGGRAALEAHRNRVSRGEVELAGTGQKGTYVSYEAAPDHAYAKLTFSGWTYELGFDRGVGWSYHSQAGVKLDEGPALEEARREADFYFLLGFEKYYARLETAARAEFHGHDAYRVDGDTRWGSKHRWYFDARTGLAIGLEQELPGGERVERALLEAQPVAGVMVPRLIDVLGRTHQIVRLNEVVLDAEALPPFEPPAPVREALAPRRIAGVVLLDGAPAPGASVTLRLALTTAARAAAGPPLLGRAGLADSARGDRERPPRGAGGPRVERTATDAGGRFTFVVQGPGQYDLAAERGAALGHAAGELPGGGERAEVVIALTGAGEIRGAVRDPDGRAIPSARVQLTPGRAPFADEIPVDAGGRFSLALPPTPAGSVATTLAVTADGFVTWQQSLAPTATTAVDLEVTLRRAATARGVVRTADGRPVPGAQVALYRPGAGATLPDRADDPPIDVATTGPDGSFELLHAPAGHYALAALNHGPEPRADLDLPDAHVRLTLAPGGDLRGAVLESDGRETLRTLITLTAEGSEREARLQTTTDLHGVFQIDDLPAGHYRLSALALDGSLRDAHADVEVVAGRRQDVRLHFPAGLAITGLVRDEAGRPVPRIEVRAMPPLKRMETREAADATDGPGATHTDDQGRFFIRDLRPGTYLVTAARRSANGRLLAQQVASATTGTRDLAITFPAVVEVRGRVVGAAGMPVPTFHVNGELQQDAAGVFSVALPARPGASVTVAAPEIGERTLELGDLTGKTVLTLPDVVLNRGRTLRGQVLAVEGRTPVPAAMLSAGARSAVATTDAAGRFLLDNAPDAPFALRVSAPGYAEATVPVAPDQDEVTVLLGAGAELRVRTVDARGAPVPGVVVGCTCAETAVRPRTDGQGQLRLRGLAPGHYYVFAVDAPERKRQGPIPFTRAALDIAAGDGAAEVVLRERAGAEKLEIVLKDSGGAPAAARAVLIPGEASIPATSRELARLAAVGYHPERLERPPAGASPVTFRDIPSGRYTLILELTSGPRPLVHRCAIDVGAHGGRQELRLPEKLDALDAGPPESTKSAQAAESAQSTQSAQSAQP